MELQAAYDSIRAEGAELIAISVDSRANARLMADHAKADYPVLYDDNHTVTNAYGLYDLLGDGVSAPATLIVGDGVSLVASHVGQSIGDRVSAQSIIETLRELNGTVTGTTS